MTSDADPRSWDYPREYLRPPLNPVKVIFCILIFFGANIGTYLLLRHVWPCLLISALIVALNLNRIIIWFVKCYQHFAPISVRSMCRFEPSCSEYMILAVKKYGAAKGIRVGVNRILRCSKGDGGFDRP